MAVRRGGAALTGDIAFLLVSLVPGVEIVWDACVYEQHLRWWRGAVRDDAQGMPYTPRQPWQWVLHESNSWDLAGTLHSPTDHGTWRHYRLVPRWYWPWSVKRVFLGEDTDILGGAA